MGIASTLAPVVKVIISLLIGVAAFYFIVSDESKRQRKQHVEEMTSQFINLVIYIWLSKILLKLPLFIKDPMSVLAYPSSASAFYLALLFSAFTIAWKAKRHPFNVLAFSHAVMQVFLLSSITYEFIQMVWNHHPYSLGYMTLLVILFISYVSMRERVSIHLLLTIILTGWAGGTWILATWIRPILVLFGYTIAPTFILSVFIICFSLILVSRRKKVS